jgi:hypothetical protein
VTSSPDRIAAYVVGETGERVQLRARRGVEEDERLRVGDAGRVVGCGGKRHHELLSHARDGRSRRDVAPPPPGAGRHRERRPVAVDAGSVAALVLQPSVGVDRDVEIDPAARLRAAVRLLPRPADREYAGRASVRAGQSSHERQHPRSIHGSGAAM